MALLDNEEINTGGLKYINPPPRRWAVVREAAALTLSFVATDYFDMSNYSFAAVFFDLTQGGITDLQWRIYHSWDQTDWYERTAEDISLTDIENASPPDSMAVSGDFKRVKVVPVLARFLRIEVAAVGTVAGSSLKVIIGGV